MRTEVGVRKDRWQRLTFGESNLSLITSVLKSPSSAVFPFMRLPKKSKTVTTDSTKPGLGFHSCDFRRNQKVEWSTFAPRFKSFHSCDFRRNQKSGPIRWSRTTKPFPFMRLPKEPCDEIMGDRATFTTRVSIHATSEEIKRG